MGRKGHNASEVPHDTYPKATLYQLSHELAQIIRINWIENVLPKTINVNIY